MVSDQIIIHNLMSGLKIICTEKTNSNGKMVWENIFGLSFDQQGKPVLIHVDHFNEDETVDPNMNQVLFTYKPNERFKTQYKSAVAEARALKKGIRPATPQQMQKLNIQ